MPITVSHQLSATTPDDPAYEIRPSHWNQSHLFTLNAAGSEISGAFGNGGGVSFGLSADGKITASAPAGGGGLTNINVSAGTTSNNLSALTFADGNGISFGLNASTLTATVRTDWLSTQSNQAFNAGGVSSAFQTLVFNDANGVTWSNNAGSVQASYSQSTHSHSTAPGGIAAGTQTATSGTVVFANSNGISFGMSGSTQITASYTVPSTAGLISAVNVSAGTTSNNLSALTFSNANGVSFGLNASTLTATVATTYRASNDAIGLNTAQSNVTWTVNSSGLSLDARGYAGTNTTFNGAGVSGSMTVNSNGVQLSMSANAGTINQTGPNIGVSNLGNTAGSTGTVSTGNVVFVGSQGITMSQSTGAAGSAATITVLGDPPISRWLGPDANALTLVTAPANATFSVNQFFVPDWVSGTRMEFLLYQSLASSATANTYGQQWSVYMGIYSNDTANNRLVSLSSGSTQTTYTVASNTAGVTQLNGSGIRAISCPVNFNMQPGEYYVGLNYVTNTFSSGTATTALARTVSLVGNAMQSASHAIVWDYAAATAKTNNSFIPAGVASAASTGLPGSISYSQITMTGASRLAANFAVMFRGN